MIRYRYCRSNRTEWERWYADVCCNSGRDHGGGLSSGGAEYDLLFLDVELKGSDSSMDGMEMAKRIRGMEDVKQPIIIFVTGYEKYVYDAFDVGLSSTC